MKSELDHFHECLEIASEPQHFAMLAHHFRIPSGVGSVAFVEHLRRLSSMPYKSLKMREMSDLNPIADVRKGDLIFLKGAQGRITNHYRSERRGLLRGSWIEFKLNNEPNVTRTLSYSDAWSLMTDGELEFWTTP